MTAPLEPTEPWASTEVAAMAQAEFQAMTSTTRFVLSKLVRLWVLLYGSLKHGPEDVEQAEREGPDASEEVKGVLAQFRAYTRFALVTAPSPLRARGERHPAPLPGPTEGDFAFPQVWTDAVDNGVQEIIDAMDAAADSVHREVPAADVEQIKTYRAERVRRAAAPTQVAKRGFAAVQEAIAQPENLTSDVRGVVVGQLVADHTEEQLERATELGDEWVCIWVPERDACVRCLAYAGLHVTPAAGQLFPGGRTWGPQWKSVVSRPDFRGPGWRELPDGSHVGSHPHCRCELRIVKRTNVHLLAAGLKREATRSAAKGWARPTEGDTVRVVAAKHALNSAIPLPKTVEQETRRRLRNPRDFPRAVPSPTR
jgi:hypothetical protein